MESALIGALVNAAVGAFAKLLIAAIGRSDHIDLGRAQTTSAINKETADAEHRAAQAQIAVPSVDRMLADLLAGKPF